MQNKIKKILSVFLATLMILSIVPLTSVDSYAANASHLVDAVTAVNRTNTLVNALNGKCFTTTQSSCGNSQCDQCKNLYIIKTSWLKNTMGLVPDTVSLLPGHYSSATGSITPSAWSCAGFANYCLWYIYAKNPSDNIESVLIYSGSFNKNNMDVSGVRTGDVIRLGDAHSFVYISHDSTGVTVLDSNWHVDVPHNVVQKHVIKWTWKSGSTMAITRGKNWTVNSNCSYGSNYLCKTCNAVNPSKITTMSDTAYIVVSDNPICRIAPYNTFNDNTVRVKKDDIVTVTGKMTNASNKLWYRLSDGKWIYSEHIKPYSVTYTDIADGCYRLKNVYTQKYLIVDSGDGSNKKNVSVWPLVESATEEKWNLTEDSLGFRIHTALSSGRVLNPYGTTVNAGNNVNIYDLIANDTTQRWKFQKVSGGYVVRNVSNPSCVLTIENGYNACVKNFVSGDTTQIWIIEPVTGCSHTYNSGTITKKATCTTTGVKTYTCTKCGTTKTETISATGHNFGSGTVTKKATCTEAGVKTYTCTRCSTTKTETISATGHNFGSWVVTKNATCTSTGTEQKTCSGCGKHETRSIEKTKHNYKSKTIAPTCTDYEKIQYVCEICNHTYYKYSEDNYSIWSETKPTGVDETLIESKTQYRYSDYETKTSYETSLSGYTKISNSWEKTNTGSVQYVKNWPSGFSTSNSQYSAYNKSAKSAYENTTNKLVVTGEQISGYLYYHWCRGTYTSGPKNRKSTAEYTSECNAFHAFFSTTAPNGLSAAGDGSYQYSNGSCCKDSYWYFYIPVYTQTYSEYKNLFTYERWTNWSDWGDTVYSSTSTRKVETRTVYRYINSKLGSHVYDNACDNTCNSCGTTRSITHTYSSASCTSPATCVICGTTNGNTLGHTYTNDCDESCNVCDEARTITHNYVRETDTNTYICSVCGDSYTEKAEAVFNNSDKAKLDDNILHMIPGVTLNELLSSASDGTYIKDSNGNLISDTALPGTGMTLVLPDNNEYTIIAYGDVDGDGAVKAADARSALRAAVGLDSLAECAKTAADIAETSEEKKITSADARYILRAAVGLESIKDWFSAL